MTDFEQAGDDEADESADELRDLLNRMLVALLKIQETQAIHESKSDPTALLRYREIQTRRLKLEFTFVKD